MIALVLFGMRTLYQRISDREAAMARLEHSEAFRRTVLNSVATEIVVVGRDGVIQAVNEPWHRRIATAAEPANAGVGASYIAVCTAAGGVGTADASTLEGGIRAVLDGRAPYFTTEYASDMPAQKCWYSTVIMPLGQNASDGLVITHTDITQLKLAETERERADARNLDLQLQLARAERMESLGRLTGGVAHDFNNLFGVILGRLQMLDDELGDRPELRNWVGSSVTAVERGATLTKSLVAFSRQLALMPVALDLNAALDGMAGMLRRVLGAAHELHLLKTPELWGVEADSGQLENALLKLVLNARDAMPRGGTLTIKTANGALGADDADDVDGALAGDYVVLSVADTGVGMPPEVAERAFEPFFTTKDVGEGSGLGLTMVYGFVKQSGGHVTIDSAPGRGTAVRIYLPRRTGEPLT